MKVFWSDRGVEETHSCIMLCAAPQPAEKRMKMATEVQNINFVPKITPSLANMTSTAGVR